MNRVVSYYGYQNLNWILKTTIGNMDTIDKGENK